MEALIPHIVPFLLVLCRLSGLMLATPILASAVIPNQVRVLLVVALAACIYPSLSGVLPPPESLPRDIAALGVAVAGEVMLGFLLGLIAMLPLAAAQLAGVVMSLQMGFGLGSIVNPALETESDPLGELLSHLALVAFLAAGGIEAMFIACRASFVRVPITGVGPANTPAELLVAVMSSGFELALRVSLPLLAIILMETVATAFVSKTMPQLNILSIGFAIKVVIGFLAIIVGLKAMNLAITDHVHDTGKALLRWSSQPAPALQ